MSYQGQSLERESYTSAEMQSVYSKAQSDSASKLSALYLSNEDIFTLSPDLK